MCAQIGILAAMSYLMSLLVATILALGFEFFFHWTEIENYLTELMLLCALFIMPILADGASETMLKFDDKSKS